MSAHPKRIAILTAGGLAPCLSAAIGSLIGRYQKDLPDAEILCYRYGYKGLLLGDSFRISREQASLAPVLARFGGSPIGNSRVKLSNVKDCVKRGLVKDGDDPRHIAASRLRNDRIDVLHTIGGDDTNTAAAELSDYLRSSGYPLTVIGLPKTIDNDIVPVRQSLGAWTAAEQGAIFFGNVASEHGASSRMLIVHEIMGRNCGWLTAATAREYLNRIDASTFAPDLGLRREKWEVHGVYIPEIDFNVEAEADRLRGIMDRQGNVNIFVSEGACIDGIISEMAASGQEPGRDAFGHVKLDTINVGNWFGSQFSRRLKAEKVLVQKSGYFARSAPANDADLRLIQRCVDHAVASARSGTSGLVGEDEQRGDELRTIEFSRVKGGKRFNAGEPWFREILSRIGQL